MGKEQQHHFMKIHSSLGKDALVLERLSVNEGMSRLFEIKVRFLANERLADMKSQIGEGVTISMTLGDAGERFFHGHFLNIRELGKPMHNSDGQRYEAVIVPRAWSATSRTNCRIFQEKTAKQIVETILGEHSVSLSTKINSSLHTYVYCVQYNETDWDFVCRLLAHEGLSFFFDHADGSHTMVITDNEKAYPMAKEASVEFCSRFTGEAHISSWQAGFRATVNSMVEHGFDFEKPDKVNDSTEETVPGKPFGSRELFDYVGEDEPLVKNAKLASLHLQGLTQPSEGYRADSNCRSFGVGLMFSFKKHEDKIPSHNEFVITEMTLEAAVPANSDNQSEEGSFHYSNSFSCMPTTEVYKPVKLPKPVVHGLQTATVTCSPGSEIYPDEHGRIKVQFHWDREGSYNQKSSCWIRVAQSWAGEGFGAQFLPRDGQEVLVEFLSGDPDQPLVTGSVYNGKNKMPYDPSGKTKNISGFRSRSTTKGNGANYNEVSFDDSIGEELLLIHAEKDHELTVENDQTDKVGNDRKTEVGNDDLLAVKNNQTVDITGDQKISAGKTITIDAGTSITLKTGAASITLESSGNISVEGTSIKVQGMTIGLKAPKIDFN